MLRPALALLARRLLVLGLVALAALSIAACKRKPPKPGEACSKEGDFVCADKTKKLTCTKGKYILENCTECTQTKSFSSSTSFTAGCVVGGIGPEGSACEGDSFDCDGKQEVKCVNGAYRHYPCGGPNGCQHAIGGITCDASISTAGDACKKEGSPAGSSDHKSLLHCKGGVYVADQVCKGPKGATVDAKGDEFTVHCDSSTSDLGDACIDGASCSADKHSVLQCKGGKYVPFLRCRGAAPDCLLKENEFQCAEPGVADVGDPCESGGACESDGKALLICKDGAFAVKSKCKTCKITGSRADCKF